MKRVLYFCWFQGIDAAPDLVSFAAGRWKLLNPEYEFRLLEQADADRELADWPFDHAKLGPAALSDCLRLKLLTVTGGVWVDATTIPTQPLRTWLEPIMARQSFFAFERPGPDRPLSSWFLASAGRADPFVTHWMQAVRTYWYKPRTFDSAIPSDPAAAVDLERLGHADAAPYFWLHYLFAWMLQANPELAVEWQHVSKLPAGAAHALQFRHAQGDPVTGPETSRILGNSPVHKLNWRHSYPLEDFAVGERYGWKRFIPGWL